MMVQHSLAEPFERPETVWDEANNKDRANPADAAKWNKPQRKRSHAWRQKAR